MLTTEIITNEKRIEILNNLYELDGVQFIRYINDSAGNRQPYLRSANDLKISELMDIINDGDWVMIRIQEKS